MSASLVGSEMCIRDSPGELRRAQDSSRELRKASEESPGESSGAPGRALAVSYTHLTLPTICSV
eukprot:6790704-Alexandrium_andersonii.AAC.1